jgi:hypothetical protein
VSGNLSILTPPPQIILSGFIANRKILSRVLVINNAGSGLEEPVYLLLIHTASNYT